MAEGECILYPCYFNAAFRRSEGRKVPRSLGTKAPVLTDIERALKRLGVKYRIEENHHPAHWARREGRIVAECASSKTAFIKKVAQKLEMKR
jgi:signal recognition particle subunit SRP19